MSADTLYLASLMLTILAKQSDSKLEKYFFLLGGVISLALSIQRML